MPTSPKPKATHLKICGITQAYEIGFLDDLGVDYAGLWSGVPYGAHNLSAEELMALSRYPRRGLKLILVTMQHSVAILESLVKGADLHGIQLHGFQLPSVVRRMREALGDKIRIFKVLHVQDDMCAEDHLIERYKRAGVDYFIIDSFVDRQRIGSTGIVLSNRFLRRFLQDRLPADRIIIAGGIDATRIGRLCRDHHPYGVDIDSGARQCGKISSERVARILAHLRPNNLFWKRFRASA